MSSSRIAKLTKEGVIAFNKKISTNHSLVNENGLLSALDAPGNKEHYERETKPEVLAASLGYGLIMNHPFQDGNKRTAHAAVKAYFKEKGMTLSKNKDVEEAHLQVASSQMDIDALAEVYRKAAKKSGK